MLKIWYIDIVLNRWYRVHIKIDDNYRDLVWGIVGVNINSEYKGIVLSKWYNYIVLEYISNK